ncbi:redox-sensitive transcriptional activator SoxR [Agromyces archimandritae]|uniref:Redox-sensitive transcriptional activator SoxR n=1 Tax=Agromyces archimandritae TaxID=2781962 RepID=A0A975IN12_9MICO|nr:redox-sensitive transcriptional activator SoxR [Agromyces archimandritae]QTX03754.1 redox-sensitive transcriptional activator SoxR [Agromyces archimandritae]
MDTVHPSKDDRLTVGEVAARSGVPISTLHFYEREGLLAPERDDANRRRYRRAELRRISFIRVAQRVGIPLAEIRDALDGLPDRRIPTRRDWMHLSARWHEALERRIADLEHLRDDLATCIGCGCLSLGVCTLENPADRLAAAGPGPRRWTEED